MKLNFINTFVKSSS